jgi:hypothetical protein
MPMSMMSQGTKQTICAAELGIRTPKMNSHAMLAHLPGCQSMEGRRGLGNGERGGEENLHVGDWHAIGLIAECLAHVQDV